MREHLGPIYEVTLCVDGASASGLDDWLAAHAAKMLEIPGFEGADISKLDDADGRHCRIVRYYVTDDDALAEYLVNQAIDMRVATVERFGENFEATARTLHESIRPVVSEPKHCLNCDAVLSGQYCGTCGQRADSRLISVWELFKDAFADLLDVDSRLWRTLHQLAFRPGQLTRDYLRGRRARYIPPFRSYLVLSLFFFLVAFFNPRDQFSLFFEPAADAEEQAAERSAQREQVLEELEAEGIIERQKYGEQRDSNLGVLVDGERVDTDCELEDYDAEGLPPWLARRLTRERLQSVCDRMFAEGGEGARGFLNKLLEYIPVGLFILLPLMALVLKALYPLSKRYYVEHLLFVLHFHAFVFLALTTQVVIDRLGAVLGLADWITSLFGVAIIVYLPVYLYKAMRRVYEQGGLATTFKFILLIIAYSLGMVAMFVSIAAIAAFAM